MNNATWKWIKGFEGIYQVSEDGRVISYHNDLKGREITGRSYICGHPYVTLSKFGEKRMYSVARLVACAFANAPLGKFYVHHHDGDTSVCSAENLFFVSSLDHMRYMGNVTPRVTKPVMCVDSGVVYPNLTAAVLATSDSRYLIKKSASTGESIRSGRTYKWVKDHDRR